MTRRHPAANRYISRLQKQICHVHTAIVRWDEQPEPGPSAQTERRQPQTKQSKTQTIYPFVFDSHASTHFSSRAQGCDDGLSQLSTGEGRVTPRTSRQFITGPRRAPSNRSHSLQRPVWPISAAAIGRRSQ